MDFIDEMKVFSKRVSDLKDSICTEESSKMSLVVPFFQLLGYDVFNPSEFCPEYTSDVGIKKGEKVDYAILKDGNPVLLIECKSANETLDKHSSQLFRYFGTSTAKFGILTNGIIYKFYTDLDETNKMDLTPFLEIDMLDLKDSYMTELKKFSKNTFDSDRIFSTAEELKYSNQIRSVLNEESTDPSEDFVRFILTNIYDGQRTQKVIEKFKPIVKKSFNSFISEIVNQKISNALSSDEPQQTDLTEEPISIQENKIITTETEIQSYYIVQGILAGTIPVEDVTYRDTESYFGILYQNNNRKPICRLFLESKKMYISIPDSEKNFTKYYLESLNEIFLHKDEIISAVKNYL